MFNRDKLRKAREKKGYTQTALSQALGMTNSVVSKYESGAIKNIGLPTLEKIANELGTTTDYLLDRTDFIEVPDYYDDNELIKVPVYGSVPAGVPIEALQVDEGYVEVKASMFRGERRYIGLKVKGDSMYPYYLEGDVVIIEMTSDFCSGDDVVVYIGDDYEATLKRIHQKPDHVELEPLNRMYPIRKFGKDDPPVRVLGVVRELRRTI